MDDLLEVTIDKLVNGGQGLAEIDDGRKVFVWNALPGEKLKIRLIRQKRSYAEAIAEEIIKPSPLRVAPREHNYLSTSPWQIMELKAENNYKAEIVRELYSREHIELPELRVKPGKEWAYRNKMEYSFWGDDDGLHLALHRRGSHGKQIVSGSELAMSAVDVGANSVLTELQKIKNIRAGDLKTIIVRATQNGQAVGGLFVKREDFYKLELPTGLKGLKVYYSNPKSPASVTTKLLHEIGDCSLSDDIMGCRLSYDVTGFFQVNLPVFEMALELIKSASTGYELVDMYSGVGSIGIPLGAKTLVELDPANTEMAQQNTKNSEVVQASSESALEYINNTDCIIVDPPRSGLHKKVIEKFNEVKPPLICYLSCNPVTQARDVAMLSSNYEISQFEVYNFFPRTPHIEALAILKRKPSVI